MVPRVAADPGIFLSFFSDGFTPSRFPPKRQYLLHVFRFPGHTGNEVINMSSHVSPALQSQFNSLSIDLKNEILSRNVNLENLNDLIAVLDRIVSESESRPS
jgi:hypothetical protein